MKPSRTHVRPVVIFDSGIGGLPYLATARSLLPGESFLYIADRTGFPYGTKTHGEVRDIVIDLVARLVDDYDPKAVVIACNTASQAGLAAVRRANPDLPIVGTVPAVKPAAERTKSGTIAVMASVGTVEDPYLDTLIAQYAKGVKVLRSGAQTLVSFVERRAATASAEERQEAVFPFVRPLVEEGADKIVLACTHFLHLRDDIAAVAGSGVEIIDSRAGVVRHLRQVLVETGRLEGTAAPPRPGNPDGWPRSVFLLTGDGPFEPEYAMLARSFRLEGPIAFGNLAFGDMAFGEYAVGDAHAGQSVSR
jgi:glutamate racemase